MISDIQKNKAVQFWGNLIGKSLGQDQTPNLTAFKQILYNYLTTYDYIKIISYYGEPHSILQHCLKKASIDIESLPVLKIETYFFEKDIYVFQRDKLKVIIKTD